VTGTDNECDVLKLVQRWAAAERLGDAELLGGLLAAEFAGVGPFGFVLARDQSLVRFPTEVCWHNAAGAHPSASGPETTHV